ncbi:diguanylate cyclase [Pseudomonas sp. NyZ704]|nr:diguanylate cyclase [Pseudomonas sp. NyZ704]
MPRKTDLAVQLRALSLAFKARLDVELQDMLHTATQLTAGNEALPEELIGLRNSLHKLAGSAGTFGYPDLGLQARKLEQLAKTCIDQRALDASARLRLVTGIQALPHWLLDSEMNPSSVAPGLALPEPDARTKIIAIFEADQQLLHATCQTLNSFGYQTRGFTDFKSLRNALKQALPDALVIATSQPDADDPALAYITGLQSQLTQPLPLIVIADGDSFNAQMEAVRAGAQGFFTRPVDLPALENRLEGCFNSLQSDPFRVLIVDDDLDLASRFKAVLSSAGILTEIVIEPSQLLQQMARFVPEVVLMDVHMPTFSGPELAQLIRLNDDWLRVPILYISAETDTNRQMEALLKAGDDFITKPISDSALLTIVYSRAQRARRVSQALARDSLTGLLKHADIKEQVVLEIERSVRTQRAASIAMIDIDHFKAVNDQHGHVVGDNVIRALANLLRQRLRKGDRLGRYGGEEFVAVLPDCNAANAKVILDEIRMAFNALQFTGSDGGFECSFSAGISACEAPQWQVDKPLERADSNLYQAKKLGRNCIII